MNTLYDNMLVLQEDGSAAIIGEYALLEADDENKKSENSKDAVLGALDEVMSMFKGRSKVIDQVSNRSTKMPKKKSIAAMIAWIGTKLITLGNGLFATIYKAIDKVWEAIKNIPGIGHIFKGISNLVNKALDGRKIGFGDYKADAKEIIKFVVTSFVLIGMSGFIVKKLKERLHSNQEVTSMGAIEPMVLAESDSNKSDTFLKKAPGVIGTLVDFAKNVGNSAVKFMVNTIGVIIAFGVFTFGAILLKPVVCKAIASHDENVKNGNVSNKDSDSALGKTLTVIKKGGAAILYHMAKVITFGLSGSGIDIFLTCDNIDVETSKRQRTFVIK